MDDSTAALASVIGDRVKRERRSRDWSLDQLAAAAGVSRRMVVNVEQGAANPSVGTLLRLSDALGVGLPALVEPARGASVRVARRGEGAVLWTGEFGGQGTLLVGTDPPDVVELWDWVLGPGDRHVSDAHARGTKELLQVQAGALVIGVGSRSTALGIGDGIAFDGDVPHSYANAGTEQARFSLAVFEPGVGVSSAPQGPGRHS